MKTSDGLATERGEKKGTAINHMQPQDAKKPVSGRNIWILTAILLVAAAWLWTRHQSHLLGVLPYLLVLACPLMHLFHHHGHHGHHPGAHAEVANTSDAESNPGKETMNRDT
jgi:uncharacterized membrane protein